MTTTGTERRAAWRPVAVIVAAGTALRLGLAFTTYGDQWDLYVYGLINGRLARDPLRVYHTKFWVYPPGLFPWLRAAGVVAHHSPLAFHTVIKLLPITADALIAVLAVWYLARHGHNHRDQVMAAVAVAFGPSFFLISGYHAQFDSVAILAAVAAIAVWDEPGVRHRALWAGLLLGAGATIKTVPLLLVIALAPTARSWAERIWLAAVAAAVPILSLFPFALADFSGTRSVAGYSGVPGIGGLSFVVQPRRALGFIGRQVPPSAAFTALSRHPTVLLLPGLAAVAIVLMVRRVPAPQASIIVWLTVYALLANFFFQYVIWGLPFLLLLGAWRSAIGAQLVLLAPTLIFEFRAHVTHMGIWVPASYAVLMVAAWAGVIVALVWMVVGAGTGRLRPGEG